jgi:FkbM family methyltransferase
MNFVTLALSFIETRVRERPSIDRIVADITAAARRGPIAFFPCNRCSNELLKLLKQSAPEAMANVVGCFDKSAEAIAEAGITVFALSELPRFARTLTSVVVTSNVFYARETQTVTRETGYTGPIVNVSGIDLELGGLEPETLITQIRTVHSLLADERSRATYLLAWLARLLNDEQLTFLFRDDTTQEGYTKGDSAYYKHYRLDHLPEEIVRELYQDAYALKGVVAAAGDTVLDIGAFKGDTAIYFADLVGPRGKVYSFEPVRANFNDLVHNVRQNELESIVTPVNKGCGGAAGRVRIATAQSGSPWAFISEDRGVEDVEITSIDTFVAEQKLAKVDFIKFDVEGLEYDVISGGKNTIAASRPKMAVSLYHNLVDLVSLPLLIDSIAEYDLYIRCRMEGPWSIFLYCAPRSRQQLHRGAISQNTEDFGS